MKKKIKKVTIHKLQAGISSYVSQARNGQMFEVMRYSTPQAVLLSKDDFDALTTLRECKKCMRDLRKIITKLEK